MMSPDQAAELAATTTWNDEEPDAWEPEDSLEDGGPTIVALGDDIDGVTLLLDNETGEILEEIGAPNAEGATAEEIAAYVGDRRARSMARLSGLQARRQAHLDRIAAQFDAPIKREQDYIRYLETTYRESLLAVWDRYTNGGTIARSCKQFLMTLKMRRTRAKVEVTDKGTAVQFLKLCCPAAVKVTESVLVSQIPASMELPESQGLKRVEPTDVFEVE